MERTLQEISRFISFPNTRGARTGKGKASVNMLDPCCGEGKALEHITPYGGMCRNRGIELDVERASSASELLDEVVQGSIFDARINPLESMGFYGSTHLMIIAATAKGRRRSSLNKVSSGSAPGVSSYSLFRNAYSQMRRTGSGFPGIFMNAW